MSADPNIPQRSQTETNHSSSVASSAAKRPYSNTLSDVNARFKRLTDHLFPESPYYITVPSDNPFRLGNRHVSNWAVGSNTVFAPEEEHLQYMTFFSHQNEDSLVVAVGSWADEKGNIMKEDEPATAVPQNGGAQKKKISLSDYKKKAQQGPTSLPDSAASSVRGKSISPKKEPHRPPKTATPEANGTQKLEPHPKANGLPSPANRNPPKRASSPTESRNTPEKTAMPSKRKMSDKDTQPPQKKPRLSTEQARDSDNSTDTGSERKRPAVPELLSPTLPSATVGVKIPKLLSPTLPDDLEEELREESSSSERQPTKKKAQSSSRSSLPPVPSKAKAAGATRPHSSSTSSGSSSSKGNGKRPELTAAPRIKEKEPKASTAPASPASKLLPTSTKASPPTKRPPAPSSQPKPPVRPVAPSRSRLIVKLKYGRQNRKRVEALLKFSGKKRIMAEQSSAKQKPSSATTPLSLNYSAKDGSPSTSTLARQREQPPTSGHKRPEPVDNDDIQPPAAKRPRSSTTTSDRPQTPAIQVTKPSPTALKKPFLTPTRDLKSVAMRRVGSADSDIKTPAGISPQSVPGSAEKPTKPSPQAADSTTVKSHEAERRSWREEYQNFAALGRELKHAARPYAANYGGDNPSGTTDEKLAAAIQVESILCFMLAFIADSKCQSLSRQPSDSNGWRSIVAYWHLVTRSAVRFPHLHGLCLLLGAISHETIHALDLERLAITSLPSEHSPAPTPGSDGNTITSEESKRQKREFADLKSRLPETYREASRLWLAGSRELSDDVLARQYPETWSRRSKNFSARGSERLRVGRYAGEYFLPLGRASLPLEAVRFGHAFLEEWCEKEGVKWRGKLTL